MISQKDFLGKLKEFGINSYEAKLWAALLSKGVSTAGELSDIANVPRSRSYDVLESLEKKGFVMTKLGKPIKFIAIPPEEVIERVKKKIMLDADERVELVDGFRTGGLLAQLAAIYKQGINAVEPSELSGCLKGRKSMYNQMELAIKGAKKSVVMITTAEGILRKKEKLLGAFKKARQRGVATRIVAPLTDKVVKELGDFTKFAELRNTDVNARFCVIDGAQAIFSVVDDKVNPLSDSGIWTNSPYFASTLQRFFDSLWADAKKV